MLKLPSPWCLQAPNSSTNLSQGLWTSVSFHLQIWIFLPGHSSVSLNSPCLVSKVVFFLFPLPLESLPQATPSPNTHLKSRSYHFSFLSLTVGSKQHLFLKYIPSLHTHPLLLLNNILATLSLSLQHKGFSLQPVGSFLVAHGLLSSCCKQGLTVPGMQDTSS